MFGKLKSPSPTCPTTLPTAWASSLRLWALRKIWTNQCERSKSLGTFQLGKYPHKTDFFWRNCETFWRFQPNKSSPKWRLISRFMGPFRINLTKRHHRRGRNLTFSLCGSSHHLGQNLSKQFTLMHQKSSQGSKYPLNNPSLFKLMSSISVKLLVVLYFCWALQSSLVFSSHGESNSTSLHIFAKVQWLHQWGDSVELLPGEVAGVDHKDGKWRFFCEA